MRVSSRARPRQSQRDRDTDLGHSAINDEVGAVDEAGLIGSEKEHSLSLFDSFSEAPGGKVYLAPETLGLIIAKPVLQQRSAVGSPSSDRSQSTRMASMKEIA
ncbi:hypothetical protein KEM52_000840, partial [Ascosphaera acerosa]